jgi:uncharacterized hydrophobic protein (TIGR00341 family)
MPLRILQIVVPSPDPARVDGCLDGTPVLAGWRSGEKEDHQVLQVLIESGRSEALMDRFSRQFGEEEGFRMILLPVEGVHPPLEEEEEEGAKQGEPEEEEKKSDGRVSRTELMEEATSSSRASGIYVSLVSASAVVAAVGLLRDDLAVIIGAMVIAPLLGPNVALSLATVLREPDLARQALKTNVVGMVVALAIAVGVGILVPVDATIPAIAARTVPGAPDIILALAAGTAGTLAFTSGYPQTVIGVMVAVALLPPVVAFGLLLGSGQFPVAAGAFLLVAANVICVNLSGVATFLARGVRPAEWWEAKQARKATLLVAGIWIFLLALLGLILYLVRRGNFGPFAT